jgi:hypothetical protein
MNAQWELVDDFENGLEAVTLANYTEGYAGWVFSALFPDETTSSWGTAERPFDAAGGMAMEVSEGTTLIDFLNFGRDLGALPTTNSYTIYYEVAMSDLSGGPVIALQEGTPLQLELGNWSNLSAVHRMGGQAGMNTRNEDGTAYASDYATDQIAETWYRFWMVIYPDQFKWDLYTQGGEFTEITKVTTAVEDGYIWRNQTFSPLNLLRFYLIVGNTLETQSTGLPTYYDNIYIDRNGVNLTSPVSSVSTPMGPGVFSDYELTEGYVDTGDWMGYVYVADYPYVYSIALGSWVYSGGGGSSGGSWFYVFK